VIRDEAATVMPAQAGIQYLRAGDGAVSKQPSVYILASKTNGTLYIGVTSDLVERIWEHKNDVVKGFTKKYTVHRPVPPLQGRRTWRNGSEPGNCD
jgi:hypothetical protein